MIKDTIDHIEAADDTLAIICALMSLVHEYTTTPPLPEHAPEWMHIARKQMQTVNISCIAISDLIDKAAKDIKHAIDAAYAERKEIAGE